MSKKIKKLIKRTRHRLAWPVREIVSGDTLMITSDHQARHHLITIPVSGGLRDMEYLHELAHATLCETIHPMFSTQYFKRGTDPAHIALITPASQTASDWFADAWLMQVAPVEELAEIEEHFALICRGLQRDPSGTPEHLFGSAMIIAQALKYGGAEISCGGVLRQAVETFLAVDPAPPTVSALAALVSGLLSILYPYRVRLVQDDDLAAWEVYEP